MVLSPQDLGLWDPFQMAFLMACKWMLHPSKLTCPLKIDGWKMYSLRKWSLFRGYVSFQGCTNSLIPYHLRMILHLCPSLRFWSQGQDISQETAGSYVKAVSALTKQHRGWSRSRWWFQIFFIFTPTWGRFPF